MLQDSTQTDGRSITHNRRLLCRDSLVKAIPIIKPVTN